MLEKERLAIAYSMLKYKEELQDLYEILEPYRKSDCCNFISHMHLGDSFYRAAMNNDLEEKYGKIHYIINPSSESIMPLFGITNYSIFDFNKYLKQKLEKYFNNDIIFAYTKHLLIQKMFSAVPRVGKFFVIDFDSPYFHKYAEILNKDGYNLSVMEYNYACAGILKSKKIDVNEIKYPQITDDCKRKIEQFDLLKNSILLLPEASSDVLLDKRVWDNIALELQQCKYTVFENVINAKNHIKGAINLNLSVNELIQFGMNCHSVISFRSGLCDILAGKGANLYVLSSEQRNMDFKRTFSFNDNFEFGSLGSPTEIFLSNCKKPQLIFEGRNLLKNVSKKYLPKNVLKHNLTKELFQTIFSVKNNNKHKIIKVLGVKFKIKRRKEQSSGCFNI